LTFNVGFLVLLIQIHNKSFVMTKLFEKNWSFKKYARYETFLFLNSIPRCLILNSVF